MVIDGLARSAIAQGLARRKTGATVPAVSSWFRLAVCAAPGEPRVAMLIVGDQLVDQRKLDRWTLVTDPTAASVFERVGVRLAERDGLGAGELFFRKAMVCEPAGVPQAAFALADMKARGGEAAAAYPLAWWVTQAAPTNAGGLVRMATLASETGRHEPAEAAFSAAADLLADSVSVNLSAALAAWRNGNHTAKRRYARRAHLLSAFNPDAMALLSPSGSGAGNLRWSSRSIAGAPLAPVSWRTRADALSSNGSTESALKAAKRALLLDPADRFSARSVAGAGLALMRFEFIRRVARRSLSCSPGDPELSYYLAQAEKAAGDLGHGWDLEADRDTWPRFHRVRGLPERALGSELPTHGLLVAAEQGIGDELLFLSCLPELLIDCPKPIVEADPRLHPLLARSFPGLRLIDRQVRAEGATAVFDYTEVIPALGVRAFLFAGDLAARYRRQRNRAAAKHGYLTVDPVLLGEWRKRIAAIRGDAEKVVGLAWSSQLKGNIRSRFNSSLEAMLPLLSVSNVRFVCLQYTDCREELADFKARYGIDIWRPDDLDQREDLDGTAALMTALDLVVSTDTSACMLAAASGCDTLRLGAGVYRALDDGDLFFSNMETMIGRDEPTDVQLAIARAACRVQEWLASDTGTAC